MKKQIFTTVIFLTFLACMPLTTTADFPTGDLGYSDDIIEGAEFEWTVKKLTVAGDFATFTDRIYVGDSELAQGDKIKVVVLEDPDDAIGDWYDVYLNDVKKTPSTLGDLIYYSMYGIGYGDFFINPVTYTNTTGTYNIYEQIYEEFAQFNDEYTYDYSDEYSGYTYELAYTSKIEFKLSGDVFSFTMEESLLLSVTGGGSDYSFTQEVRLDTTVNIRTGLFGKMELFADVEYPGTLGSIHMIIDSGYAKTPYEWTFSFLGLTVIAAVVALAKRNRR